MKKKKGRFSRFIRPILSLYDLGIINLIILYHFNFETKGLVFSLLSSLAWIVISVFTNFYKVYMEECKKKDFVQDNKNCPYGDKSLTTHFLIRRSCW